MTHAHTQTYETLNQDRPFRAWLRTSHCSTNFDFHTFEDAREYLAQQLLRCPQFTWTTGRETMNFRGTYLEVKHTGRTYNLVDLELCFEGDHHIGDQTSLERLARVARADHYGIVKQADGTYRKPWLG